MVFWSGVRRIKVWAKGVQDSALEVCSSGVQGSGVEVQYLGFSEFRI